MNADLRTAVLRWQLLFLPFAIGMSSRPAEAQDPVPHPESVCSRENLKASTSVSGFVFRTYALEDAETCFQVIRDGKVIFRRTSDNGGGFFLGQRDDKDLDVPAIADGTDLTGRGNPDMIVAWRTGGAHCCLIHYVFELQPAFRLLAKIDGQDDGTAHFAPLDSDGRYYYLGTDWTFSYWPSSFAGSPHHSIVLRFIDDSRGGSFHLALDKMKKDTPTEAAIAESLSEINDSVDDPGAVVSALWQTVVDLIYSGNSDLAWKFVAKANPKALQGNNPSLNDFCSRLKWSLYWRDLAPTLHNVPPECSSAVPGYR